MAGDHDQGRTELSVRPAVLDALAGQIGASIERREEIRVWSMSAVERLTLSDGSTLILKYANEVFADEPDVLRHAAAHGVPVPKLLTSTRQPDGSVVMITEDLGDPVREPTLADAATAAVSVHTCPPLDGLPVLDEHALVTLPLRALEWLDALQRAGRWTTDTFSLRRKLEALDGAAHRRAKGVTIPPYGMCHSEFHPTSLIVQPDGVPRVLDMARAYTGNGLLDLVSWQGTPEPLDLNAVKDLMDAYVAAGGPEEALLDRGGLPAHVWASGWDKLWIVEWLMESNCRWGDPGDPERDHAVQKAISRHLKEAVECLTN
ncbi:aminoglycoside phosphotransferase/kinase family protein [Actinomadura harenae]|uniref:Aminoglycoside phosphotransferase family protein n=1 Tax=Actinomadura harenae TaxID=2483351 RepID=A0A3M2M163_9ACTN|nr:phosphotransferase [Actinomadura harenae]RMI42165.1 aminoglycoside phosphotransferase family protein [Actinomadura harenae]